MILWRITKLKTIIAIIRAFLTVISEKIAIKRRIMAMYKDFGGKSTLDNANGVCGNALAAARKAELFLCGGFYVYVFW